MAESEASRRFVGPCSAVLIALIGWMGKGNSNDVIAGRTIPDPRTHADSQALRDKCEELADDVRALSTLVHALRREWLAWGA